MHTFPSSYISTRLPHDLIFPDIKQKKLEGKKKPQNTFFQAKSKT